MALWSIRIWKSVIKYSVLCLFISHLFLIKLRLLMRTNTSLWNVRTDLKKKHITIQLHQIRGTEGNFLPWPLSSLARTRKNTNTWLLLFLLMLDNPLSWKVGLGVRVGGKEKTAGQNKWEGTLGRIRPGSKDRFPLHLICPRQQNACLLTFIK
jgi:hypothetical protein